MIHFTVGPSKLYPGIQDVILDALNNYVPSTYHRSIEFAEIYTQAENEIKKLLSVPESHAIFFLSGASEIWERILQNLVQNKSVHYINGSFGKKFHDYALSLGIIAEAIQIDHGLGLPPIESIMPDKNADLICITQNETSTGVSIHPKSIYALKNKFPNAQICIDIVSSVPYVDIDYNLIDTAFFSVQKGFGMPAGLGVWILNKNCIKRHQKFAGSKIGSQHHRLDFISEAYNKKQTQVTPNTLAIYLLGKIAKKMNDKGIETIRSETKIKANLIYDAISNSKKLTAAITDPELRSQTTIAVGVQEPVHLMEYTRSNQIILSSGYGATAYNEIRIANFPAHTIEDVHELIQVLQNYDNL